MTGKKRVRREERVMTAEQRVEGGEWKAVESRERTG